MFAGIAWTREWSAIAWIPVDIGGTTHHVEYLQQSFTRSRRAGCCRCVEIEVGWTKSAVTQKVGRRNGYLDVIYLALHRAVMWKEL